MKINNACLYIQVLPCLHPPGIHVIIDDAFGERVYDEIIHNKTAIPLGELPGTYIVINVTEGDGSAIGLNVSILWSSCILVN